MKNILLSECFEFKNSFSYNRSYMDCFGSKYYVYFYNLTDADFDTDTNTDNLIQGIFSTLAERINIKIIKNQEKYNVLVFKYNINFWSDDILIQDLLEKIEGYLIFS